MYGDTPVGELLFNLMKNKSIIDTHATETHLWENMTNLDTYMSTVNSNIGYYNHYVKVNVDGLKARGEHKDDLVINLFKVYWVASDGDFLRYKKEKRDQYSSSHNITKDELVNSTLLMR